MSRRNKRPPYIQETNKVWYFTPGPAMRRAGVKGCTLGAAGSKEARGKYNRVLTEADKLTASAEQISAAKLIRAFSVGDAINAWHQHTIHKGTAKPKTLTNYRQLTGALHDLFGDIPAAAMNLDLLEEWYFPFWREKPYMAKNMASVLRMALRHAAARDLISKDPLAGARLPGGKPRQRMLERSELQLIMETARQMGLPGVAHFCAVAVTTLQRPKDIMQFSRADLQKRLELIQSKRGASIDVKLHPWMMEQLADAPDSGVLIIDHDGGGYSHRYRLFNKRWDEVRRATEAKPLQDIWAYDLKTTGMVFAAQGGAEIADIASLSGHSIERTAQILKHYMPRNAVLADRAVAAIDPVNEPVVEFRKRRTTKEHQKFSD